MSRYLGKLTATDPEHISGPIDRALANMGVHPDIIAAAERESNGEYVDWDEVFHEMDPRNRQMELGVSA